MFDLLMQGFSNAMTSTNILFLFVGVLWGNMLGVLPGIGPVQGIALLIPLTFKLPATTALLMLAGIYYGAQYGGSTTAILLNIPGETSAIMTAVEGYPLNLQGRGGAALGMSAFSSFIAGTLSVVGLMLLSPPLAKFGLSMGPAETFSLILCAFTLVGSLGGDSVLKGLLMGAIGVMIGSIGTEPVRYLARMTFGMEGLREGVSLVAAALGLFALPEVIRAFEKPGVTLFKKMSLKVRNLMPTWQDFKDSKTAIPQGFVTGFLVGVNPGTGAGIASFLAYVFQKRISKKPELFGKGSMEAIAAIEGANNAAAGGTLIPMLTLGIPGGGSAAMIMGAMIIHGLRPGPLLFQNNPEVVWTLVASMYLGNLMLFILNLPLIGMWISFLRLPQRPILAAVLAVTVAGVYAEDNAMGNVFVMFGFGIFGYFLRKFDFPIAPIMLGVILTKQLESGLRLGIMLSDGDWSIFFTQPISLFFLIAAALSIILQTPLFGKSMGWLKRWKGEG